MIPSIFARSALFPDLGVGIEREVIGDQGHVRLHHEAHALRLHPDDGRGLALQNQPWCTRSASAPTLTAYSIAARLAVTAVTMRRTSAFPQPEDRWGHNQKPFRFQIAVNQADQFRELHFFSLPIPLSGRPMLRRLWLIFAQAVTIASAVGWAYVLTTSSPHEAPVEARAAILATPVGGRAGRRQHLHAHDDAGDGAEETGSDWNASPERELHPLGSGVIVSKDGHVLTNYHVVEEAPNLPSRSPTDARSATLAGGDAETDLATLVIKGEDLPSLSWATAARLKIRSGRARDRTPSTSSRDRDDGDRLRLGPPRPGGWNNYEDFIQTDAAINQREFGRGIDRPRRAPRSASQHRDLLARALGRLRRDRLCDPDLGSLRQVLPAMLKGGDVRRATSASFRVSSRKSSRATWGWASRPRHGLPGAPFAARRHGGAPPPT